MKIALIGASGQLGTDLQKVIPQDNLINLNYPDFDITHQAEMSKHLFGLWPDMIINTAAYNLVDQTENHPDQALAVNYVGVKNLIEVCLKLNSPLIHFSSDYVFGAERNRREPYTEESQPGPINQYGLSKLKGEQVIQNRMKKYFIIRTSGLFGIAGSEGKGGNFIESVIKKSQVEPELKIVDDQVLTPTYTLDLAKNIWKLIQTPNYGLFHITSEGECSWYEFTCQVFRCLNKTIKIKPIKTVGYPSAAHRPYYSVLENKKLKELGLNLMRLWPETVPDYLREKGYI